jgi:hypothetical protein
MTLSLHPAEAPLLDVLSLSQSGSKAAHQFGKDNSILELLMAWGTVDDIIVRDRSIEVQANPLCPEVEQRSKKFNRRAPRRCMSLLTCL